MNIIFAFLASLLTGLGVGSGGLLVIYLTFFEGFEQITAQAVNLMFFISAAFVSAVVNLFKRRIYLLPSVIIIIFGVCGSLLGTFAVIYVGSDIARKIFGGFLLFTGIYGLFIKKND